MPPLFAPETGQIWWIGLLVLGLTVGLIAGMFGIGGGFLLVPALNMVFGVPIDVAVGTGLCITPGTGVAALRRHRKLRQGEVKVDWLMLGGALVGVTAGAHTVGTLAELGNVRVLGSGIPAAKLTISSIYIVVLCAIAGAMIRESIRGIAVDSPPPGPLTRILVPPVSALRAINRDVSASVCGYVGLALGFLSGLIGIGGGTILMPILVYGIGMPVRMAAGTGIVLLIATSLAGTISHVLLGHVDLRIAVVLLLGSTLGAPIGATATSQTSGARLRGIFGGLALVTAAAIAWGLFRVAR